MQSDLAAFGLIRVRNSLAHRNDKSLSRFFGLLRVWMMKEVAGCRAMRAIARLSIRESFWLAANLVRVFAVASFARQTKKLEGRKEAVAVGRQY
jgi:hypothetical protein